MPFIDYQEPARQEMCNSPEHNPPNMIVLSPGRYTWQCPVCGALSMFTVPFTVLEAPASTVWKYDSGTFTNTLK